MGDHLAASVVDGDQCGGKPATQRVAVVAGELLEAGLGGAIDGEVVHEARLVLLHFRIGEVWGEHGELAAHGRHALGHGTRGLLARDDALRGGMGQHTVARAPRGLGEAIWPAQLGRLRQRHEEGRFRQRQAPRLLAEVGERGRAHAFEIAAEGGEAEIESQDSVLGQLVLQRQRAQGLAQLAGARALVLAGQQAGHLHSQRRAAGNDARMPHEQPGGAADRIGVHAVVGPEALVLESQQHGKIARVDVLHLDGQAPASVGRGVGAQQAVVAVEHGDGEGLGAGKRQRLHPLPDDGERDGACDDQERHGKCCSPNSAPRRAAAYVWRAAPALSPLFSGERVRVRGSYTRRSGGCPSPRPLPAMGRGSDGRGPIPAHSLA